MARAVHFEITAENPERTVRFYEQALGWKIRRWAGSAPEWLESTGGDGVAGIDGAIMDRPVAGQSMMNIISVPSLEVATNAVGRAGGTVVGEIHTIPGVGRFVYATDTEGRRFGLMEEQRHEALSSGGPGPRIV
jgi:uncharacterized protein